MLTVSRETERVDRVNRFNGTSSHKRADYKINSRPKFTFIEEQSAQTSALKSKLYLDYGYKSDRLFLEMNLYQYTNTWFFMPSENHVSGLVPYYISKYHCVTITAPWYWHNTFQGHYKNL